MNCIILCLLIIGITADVCPRYVCSNLLPKNMCFKKEKLGNQITFKSKYCLNKMVCDIVEDQGFCKAHYSVESKYPGEYCFSNEECFSHKCDKSLCIGKGKSEACSLDMECSEGLYCNSTKVCAEVLKKDQECSETDKCDAFCVCSKKMCTEIMSLDNGEEATNSRACKSMFISGGKCSEGWKLKGLDHSPGLGPCVNDQCVYYLPTDPSKNMTSPCVCSRGESGLRVCNPGIGDLDLSPFASYVHKESSQKLCHVSRGPLCQSRNFTKMGNDYFGAYVAYHNMTNLANYFNASTCVTRTIELEYWYYLAHYIKPDGPAKKHPILFLCIPSTLIVFILSVFLYFRKMRLDIEASELK